MLLDKRRLDVIRNDPTRAVRAAQIRAKNLVVKGRANPDSTTFAKDARPGPTATTFASMRGIQGWFTYDDAAHFTLVLAMQSAQGLHGDILEIGPFHGRSTIVLAEQVRDGETLVVCDPFQSGDVYVADPPTPTGLRRNVTRGVPGFDQARLVIHEVYSTDLHLDDAARFRFVHVDGSHERDDVLSDLRLARRHLLPGGVIVADDYDHPDWPGVTEAVDAFVAETPELVTLADLNRHSESGRKRYLMLATG
ncbi:class I SAM-dependent methyltransferase [Nocardioides aurantiacus]|uniref:Methyltransferase family protein n=1 Tax=Nocardioides aurantiacus TaxID=86796 RepID=A0A3N2CWE5_9ACTN|nr:class I SAM-dependent methyltransferase [Nocardioides aurantiacus]ROR91786.1 methyltransferase family protein [Nocardioides aurantiacus]